MTFSRACALVSAALSVCLALVMGLATRTAWATPPAAVDVATLLQAFSRMPGLEARFVEEKQLALLAKPLESRGRLYFAHPGFLLRRVEAPQASEVVITPDSVRLRDAGGEQTLDLRARKDLRPFVESLTWLLAGNRAALEQVYAISFQPGQKGGPWQLTLTPKAAPLSQLIAHLRIVGRTLSVEQIEVLETGGDRTLTRIVEANPARTFDAAEKARLFGATGASRPPR